MKAADWVLAQPWAITEEALGVIIAIAERRNESPEAVEAKLGRPLDNTHETTTRDGVALIPVVGPISRYADFFSQISGATAIETLARDFRTALDDRSVKAIVLNMDTPGGTVAGVSEFASQVMAARGTKPIVAYVGSQAASAGYWIASAADRIVADPTAMLGSIGVVMGVRKPADDKPGQAKTVQFVSSQSPNKRPDPETETGKATMQEMVDDTADVFVNTVASNRGASRETVLSDFGRGGQLIASKAVESGMADGLGSLEQVIACLSRGEMPCPAKKPKVAPKATNQPRRPAMSEQIEPPVAGNQVTMSAADYEAIQDRLKAAEKLAKDEASGRAAAVEEAINANANAFMAEFAPGIHATAYGVGLRKSFIIAAQDDAAHPVAGSKSHRQDALRETLKARPAPTKEVVAGDEGQQTRALASDPADETKAQADAKREERRKRNQGYVKATGK